MDPIRERGNVVGKLEASGKIPFQTLSRAINCTVRHSKTTRKFPHIWPGKKLSYSHTTHYGGPFFPSPYESERRFFLSFLSGSLLLLVEFGERSFLGRKRGRWEDSPVPVIKGPTEKRKGHEKERERDNVVRSLFVAGGRKENGSRSK